MKEKLVSFRTAVLAKKKGFEFEEDMESECFYEPNYMYYAYHNSGKYILNGSFSLECRPEGQTQYIITDARPLIPAPTLALLSDWLMEHHGIHIDTKTCGFDSIIYELRISVGSSTKGGVDTLTYFCDGVLDIAHHLVPYEFKSKNEALEKGIYLSLMKLI